MISCEREGGRVGGERTGSGGVSATPARPGGGGRDGSAPDRSGARRALGSQTRRIVGCEGGGLARVRAYLDPGLRLRRPPRGVDALAVRTLRRPERVEHDPRRLHLVGRERIRILRGNRRVRGGSPAGPARSQAEARCGHRAVPRAETRARRAGARGRVRDDGSGRLRARAGVRDTQFKDAPSHPEDSSSATLDANPRHHVNQESTSHHDPAARCFFKTVTRSRVPPLAALRLSSLTPSPPLHPTRSFSRAPPSSSARAPP